MLLEGDIGNCLPLTHVGHRLQNFLEVTLSISNNVSLTAYLQPIRGPAKRLTGDKFLCLGRTLHEFGSSNLRKQARETSGAVMAQSDSSPNIEGNAEDVQRGGSDDAQSLSKGSTPAWVATKAAVLGFIFRRGESKGKKRVTTSGSPSSSLMTYSSTRIERITQMSAFPTDIEFEIEVSKDHWSQLTSPNTAKEGVEDAQSLLEQGVLAGKSRRLPWIIRYNWEVKGNGTEVDRAIYDILAFQFPHRFWDHSWNRDVFYYWKVGRKIGEGAHAEIYKAVPTSSDDNRYNDNPFVFKVFKKGFFLRDMQKLWPMQIITGYCTLYTCPIRRGKLSEDGRFAFLMPRYWGDLRKLLDLRMQHRPNSTQPPFSYSETIRSMECIAKGMRDLHNADILHRDLKASNVLVELGRKQNTCGRPAIVEFYSKCKAYKDARVAGFDCRVADFECSAGVVGTTFWRAPGILLALKYRNITPSLFTQKSIVYSYGMTCYEILTGCIPFENLSSSNYDVILKGARPELPSHLRAWIHSMLERCWHPNPLERPAFQEIFCTLASKTNSIHSLRACFL